MINALHLLWIVPLSAWFGMFIAALLMANDDPVISKGGKTHGKPE